jgi:hypothetical protein
LKSWSTGVPCDPWFDPPHIDPLLRDEADGSIATIIAHMAGAAAEVALTGRIANVMPSSSSVTPAQLLGVRLRPVPRPDRESATPGM